MDINTFIKQVTDQLKMMKVTYQISNNVNNTNNTNISITATFNKQQEEDITKVIVYDALVFLNPEKNTVYAYEKAILNQVDIASAPGFEEIKVKSNCMDAPEIRIGSILGSITSIAKSSGLYFEKTDNLFLAGNSVGYIPIVPGLDTSYVPETSISPRFCTYCGAKMIQSTRFCSACGADSLNVSSPQPKSAVSNVVPPVFTNVQQPYVTPTTQYEKPKKKTSALVIILIIILVIGILTTGGIFLVKWYLTIKDPLSGATASNSVPTTTPSGANGSAVVAVGVPGEDLGNIINGQFYFSTDQYAFYSSFDTYNQPHIYRANIDGTDLKSIFDGFGWSLVVKEDWLYFSGYQGLTTDGTYNLFRMHLDGTQVERINPNHCYGMFLYSDYLYYMKKNPNDSMWVDDTFSICRSALDGSNEEVLFPSGANPIIYNDMLYYLDSTWGNIMRCKPDGTETENWVIGMFKAFTFGNGMMIYLDTDSNIYTANPYRYPTLIRETLEDTVFSIVSYNDTVFTINSLNDRIFFGEYVGEFNNTTYGRNYVVKSIKFDGSDEKVIASSFAYQAFINVVHNKLMLLDNVYNPDLGLFSATVKSMDIDGSNQSVLDR